MTTICTAGKKDTENWECEVKIQNEENEKTVLICYGEGEMDNDEQDKQDVEFYSGLQIENTYYEGFTQAVERYLYAKNNNNWQYPKEYYVNNGRMSLL